MNRDTREWVSVSEYDRVGIEAGVKAGSEGGKGVSKTAREAGK